SRPEQRAQLKALAPDARWCATADELLAEAPLDFVDICTPPSSHASLIQSALERDLHVLCEKPLVGSLDELMPLARLAEKTGRRHVGWDVEDTATVRVTFSSATAEIVLTWASDERKNWAEVSGTSGRLELQDDTLVLRHNGHGSDERWRCPPAMSTGSHHPDW